MGNKLAVALRRPPKEDGGPLSRPVPALRTVKNINKIMNQSQKGYVSELLNTSHLLNERQCKQDPKRVLCFLTKIIDVASHIKKATIDEIKEKM